MHPLLARQLKKVGVLDASHPPSSAAWAALLERIDHSYLQADQDRYTLERSLSISSREMDELNAGVRHAAATLAQERDYLRALIESTADGLCTLDAAGRITRTNPAAERLLARPAIELVGRELLGDVLARASQAQLCAALNGACDVRCDDGLFERGDGLTFPVSFALSPIAHAGERMGSVLVFRDTTEQKRIQLDLESARAAAESACKAKSGFLAMMSHEIRTPLNGVIGMADLLAHTALDGEQADYVETIHNSGSTLLAIINDVLDFSKIEAGMLELEEVDFDLRSAVEEVLEMLADRAHAKGLELVARVAGDVPVAVRGDPWRTRQVLLNLVGNAIKYTPSGEVVLSIASERRDDSSVTLTVRVRDTGIGVPEAARERLFKAFSQADSSTTRQFGGTGLGLAISRMLVERMGGQLGHEPAPGGGSVFWFECVLRADVHAPAWRQTVLRRDSERGQAARRVALIEPHAVARAVMAEIARGCDCEVAEYASLDELRDVRGAVLIVEHDSWARRRPGGEHENAARVIVVGPRSKRSGTNATAGTCAHMFVAKPVRVAAFEKVLLDVLAAQLGEREQPARERPPVPAPLPRLGARRLRILVAEDNAVNQRVVGRMLERMGHEVEMVENGWRAVDATLAGGFDLVLMDCQMPEVDGFEATRRILSAASPFRAPPIVALTANAMSDDEGRCRAAGMLGYLTKPLRSEALERLLSSLFPERDASEAAPPRT